MFLQRQHSTEIIDCQYAHIDFRLGQLGQSLGVALQFVALFFLASLIASHPAQSQARQDISTQSSYELIVEAHDLDEVDKLAIPLIMEFEGFVAVKYRCPAGILTTAFGFTGRLGCGSINDLPDKIDRRLGIELLLCDERKVREILRRHVKVPLTSMQRAALVSWIYNMGEANLAESTMLERLNEGNYREAASELLRWHKVRDPETNKLEPSRGLIRRRHAEYDLFMRGTI